MAGWGCGQNSCSQFGSKHFCWEFASMKKTVHTKLSQVFCDRIRSLRDKAGMTQRDLAAAIDREHGMVARIELGERRVDFVEAFELFKALGADPASEAASVMKQFENS
jgi:HTH-type transcriptional regulator/antitoxin HipB